jgi:hypothetical protein
MGIGKNKEKLPPSVPLHIEDLIDLKGCFLELHPNGDVYLLMPHRRSERNTLPGI